MPTGKSLPSLSLGFLLVQWGLWQCLPPSVDSGRRNVTLSPGPVKVGAKIIASEGDVI